MGEKSVVVAMECDLLEHLNIERLVLQNERISLKDFFFGTTKFRCVSNVIPETVLGHLHSDKEVLAIESDSTH